MGFFSSALGIGNKESHSSTSNTTNYNLTDNSENASTQSGTVLTGGSRYADSSTTTYNALDGGAVQAALETGLKQTQANIDASSAGLKYALSLGGSAIDAGKDIAIIGSKAGTDGLKLADSLSTGAYTLASGTAKTTAELAQDAFKLVDNFGKFSGTLATTLGGDAMKLSSSQTNVMAKLAQDYGDNAARIVSQTTGANGSLAADSIAAQNKAMSMALEASASTARDALAANTTTTKGAFALVGDTGSKLMSTFTDLVGMTKHVADKNDALAGLAIGKVQDAWGDAKQFQADGGANKYLIYAALAVVALVGFQALRKAA